MTGKIGILPPRLYVIIHWLLMHRTLFLLVALTAGCFPAVGFAQTKPPEIKRVQIGFHPYEKSDPTSYKVGLWTPIHVDVYGGADGIKHHGDGPAYVEIETSDSEDVGTKIRFQVAVAADTVRSFTGYVKTGHMGQNFSELKVTLHADGREYAPRPQELARSVDIDRHLYLVLGRKIPELHKAVKRLNQGAGAENDGGPGTDNNARQVVFKTDITQVPEKWFGYNGVDLLILATENNGEFLHALNDSPERIEAIATWVRRGGRLVVPIAPAQQDVVARILNSPKWQPPIPVRPPQVGGNYAFTKLPGLASWGGQVLQPADPANPIPIATLEPGSVPAGDWKVLLGSSDEVEPRPMPMVAQVRYGLGQITYVAISLEDDNFDAWPGKERFLQTLIQQTAPKAPARIDEHDIRFARREIPDDVATELVRRLDEFDVTVIPFGYVALFIILYILIVGPLDYVLLKHVFKRLEWTWITFPSVVLGVSVLAYFAAYAQKGRELKVNKVDIVDFDMRTHVDKQTRQPLSTHAFGQSFFTILSPRIQNYTIGIEPNPLFWGAEVKRVKGNDGTEVAEVFSADLLSWIGRPSGGMHDMGRGGSGGFFRKPYAYKDDASALASVPIPVWTTKAFTASWERKLDKPPFGAELFYHLKPVQGKELKITGTIKNHLGVDLEDVWLIYDKRFYRIDGGLKRGGQVHTLAISGLIAPHATEWLRGVDAKEAAPRVWATDPTDLVKRILFTESLDPQSNVRNHLLRALDQSWRIQDEPRGDTDRRTRPTREAILFGRVRHVNGAADALMRDAGTPLATKLWLQDTPDTGKALPITTGQMNQDTYVRVFLPLRSGDD